MTTPLGHPCDASVLLQSLQKCSSNIHGVQESAEQHITKLLISGSNEPVPLKVDGVTQLVRGCQSQLFPKLPKYEFPYNLVHEEKKETVLICLLRSSSYYTQGILRKAFITYMICKYNNQRNIIYSDEIVHNHQENDKKDYSDKKHAVILPCFLMMENEAVTDIKLLLNTCLRIGDRQLKIAEILYTLADKNYANLILTMQCHPFPLPDFILLCTELAIKIIFLHYHCPRKKIYLSFSDQCYSAFSPSSSSEKTAFAKLTYLPVNSMDNGGKKFNMNRFYHLHISQDIYEFMEDRIYRLILFIIWRIISLMLENIAFELDKKDEFYLELGEKHQTPYNASSRFYMPNLEVKNHNLENSGDNGKDNKDASNDEKVISELQTYCKTTDYSKCKMDDSHLPFSKTDSLSSLGKGLKLRIYNWQNAPQHTFHQTLHVYPVFNQNVKPTFHNLMRYEIFRIGTFAYFNISTETNFWVTRLAESGFYNVDGSGRICCFSCGSMCEVADEQTLERAHMHDCRRQEQNIPLNEWTVGLNRGDSHPYFSLFGNLTPTLFDESEPTLDNLTTALDTLNIESAAGDTDQNATRDIAFAEMPDGNDHRQPQSSDLEGFHDPGRPGISPNNNSLPTNLNEVSSGLVIQESDGSASREVLTSASIEPMSMSHTPIQTVNVIETPGPEQNNTVTEEGAVGGQTSYDLGRASYPQFASSAARRSTFVGWNPDHPQRPDDLVAGGFFYAGYADCVRCFYCGLGLKYWRPTDLPTYQHARFRPNCVYNRMYKGQEYIDKVQQDLREEQALAVPNETNADNQVATEYAPEPSVPDVTQPPPSPPDQGHEYMNLPASQEALRIGWRSEQIVQAVTNVVEEMGIVPENVQFDMLLDVLRELYSADDAPRTNLHNIPSRREETISSSSVAEPSMASIRQPPPSTPLDPDGDELKKTRTTGSDSPAVAAAIETADGAATVEVSDVPAGSQEQYHALSRENAFLNQRTICTICQRQPVSCIYLPCGHVIACQGCARNESICRSCHRKIAATSNIYLS